jgi:capsular exopolysaccharide synthesis family protein
MRRFWPLATAVFGVCVLIGVATSFGPEPQYQANALLFAQMSNASLVSEETTLLPLILSGVVQQVETDVFEKRVSAAAPASANATLSASNDGGTPVLTVTAQSTNPETALIAANAAARELLVAPITNTVTLSVLEPATKPGSPVSPRKSQILAGSIVLGLILAFFAAVAADAMRKRVAGPDTIRENFGLMVIGEIQQSRRARRPPRDLFSERGSFEIAEEYQRLRTNFSLISDGLHTVMVTSWREGEGKTSVTANLGWALASLGRRVTIVDLDLRRPSLDRMFGVELAGGVGELVSAGSGAGSAPKRTGMQGLDVLTAGTVVESPARVIEKAFPPIVEELNDRLLLIDTAPLLVAETSIVASLVDAVVIVVDVRRREPGELETMLQMLKLTQAKILGVVLNHAHKPSRASGRYYTAATRSAGRESSPARGSMQRWRGRRAKQPNLVNTPLE